MQDSEKREIYIHDMPWLVINDTGGHAYVAARFLSKISAIAYVQEFRSDKIGNYFVCHRSELDDKYQVFERPVINM